MKLVEYITIFREFYVIIMAGSKSNAKGTEVENTEVDTNQNNSAEVDDSLDKAIKLYTKIHGNEEMLEGSKEQKKLDRDIEEIKNRKIITEFPILCALHCIGTALLIKPTVFGERWRFN